MEPNDVQIRKHSHEMFEIHSGISETFVVNNFDQAKEVARAVKAETKATRGEDVRVYFNDNSRDEATAMRYDEIGL